MSPSLQRRGQPELSMKVRAVWERRERALKEGSFQEQLLAGSIQAVDFGLTQRSKMARQATKVFRGEDMMKALIEGTNKKIASMPDI